MEENEKRQNAEQGRPLIGVIHDNPNTSDNPTPPKRRYRIRKLTPRECLRLMGLRDFDIDKMVDAKISESQLYKMAGNSIVVDCLVHGIFINLFLDNNQPSDTLF